VSSAATGGGFTGGPGGRGPDPDEPTAKLRLGGMALRNGLLVHGPTHWAAAVRRDDGTIAVASGRKPRVQAAERVPGVRGVVKLGEAMAIVPLVKRALPQARLPIQSPVVIGAAAGAALVGAHLRRRCAGSIGGELAATVVSMAPAVAALRGGELAAYHGVEHKAIAAYEQGAADARDAAKEHDRCGSHLLAPMLAANLAGTALAQRVSHGPPDGAPVPLPRWAHGAIALVSAGVAVELFVWSERHAQTAAARALRRPGHELQRLLGTREPSEHQLDVGRAALGEILRVEAAA
jgi:uncharacterized protein YqhQ